MELEMLICEIRALRVKRAFGLSDDELVKLIRKDERAIHMLYELYVRYGEAMDKEFADAAVVYLLSSQSASFEDARCQVSSSGRRGAQMTLANFGSNTPLSFSVS